VTPENIKTNTFEILLAIDDVISAGIRETTSVSQVRNALEMESSEEKLHLMLMKARVFSFNIKGK
jgi:coatomer subunit delta